METYSFQKARRANGIIEGDLPLLHSAASYYVEVKQGLPEKRKESEELETPNRISSNFATQEDANHRL